jgi:hypothetical protein
MRFMLLLYPRGDGEGGEEAGAAMLKYNEALTQSGVLLAWNGLKATSHGVRVRQVAGQRRLDEGPFEPSPVPVGGYWMLAVRSRPDALAWAARCPLGEGDMIELREVSED